MAFAAKVSTQRIVHLLDAMPNYSEYGEIQRAMENETSYRLALGYILKGWGDQLLDLAEQQPGTLSRSQTRMVDALLEGIGEIFATLNSMRELGSFSDEAGPQFLQESDAKLLKLLERAQRIVVELRQREFSGVWIEKHAKSLFRTFHRIEKVLASRNDLLGTRGVSGGAGPAGGSRRRGELI
jgi:hypothetical protein